MVSKTKVIASLFICSALLQTSISPSLVHADQDDDEVVRLTDPCDDVKSKSKSSSKNVAPGSTAVEGDWMTPGSEANAVAQEIFDTFTKEFGTSGAFASGVIANAINESALIPDRCEGSGTLRFGMNSKTVPAGGYNSASPSNLPGGGLFQETPYTVFTESEYWGKLKPDGWAPANQTAFLWANEFANKAVMTYVTSTDPSYGAALYGKTPDFQTIEQFLSTDDPAKAAAAFQYGYERPAAYHPEREDTARQVNAVFNKDNVKADPSKWKFTSSSSTTVVNGLTSQKDKKKLDDCGIEIEENSGVGGSWGEDGTGSHNYKNWDRWKANELPDDLKKYALDPTKVGMKLGGEGWSNPGGQCVHFSSSFLYALWEKDGKRNSAANGPTGSIGNHSIYGKDTAESMAIAYGGKTSSKPTKGAVASTPPGAPDAPGFAGHTWIVSHVFENGDILIIEQNMTNVSGDNIGAPNTWSYRIATTEFLNQAKPTFFDPSTVSYEPAKDIQK